MKTLYCGYVDTNGEIKSGIYYGMELFYRDTFSHMIKTCEIIELSARGKTYAERKADIADKAYRCQLLASVAQDLSYGEFETLSSFFEKMGKRYGLYTEFVENNIC